MKRIVLGIVCTVLAFYALADGEDDKKKKEKKPVPVPVYFMGTTIDQAELGKREFDALIKKGFTSIDSNGRVFNVEQFMFTFCERNLYEDSVGNPMILTDYLSEYSFSNQFKEYQLEALLRRAKPGDTVFIEKIKLTADDSTKVGAQGIPMKIVITR